jgi:hypothetical protein
MASGRTPLWLPLVTNYAEALFDSEVFWRWLVTPRVTGVWTCPPSDILKKTTFRQLDPFPSSGQGVGDTVLGPVEGADLSRCTLSSDSRRSELLLLSLPPLLLHSWQEIIKQFRPYHSSVGSLFTGCPSLFFTLFVRLLALRPPLAYCASLGW